MKNTILVLLLLTLFAQGVQNKDRILDTSPWGDFSILGETTVGDGEYAFEVAVDADNNIAYVAANLAGISVVDVSDSTNPVEINVQETNDIAEGVILNSKSDTLFVRCQSIQIFDVSDATNFVQLAYIDTSEEVKNLKLSSDETLLYVLQSNYYFQIYDISDLSNPTLIGEFTDLFKLNKDLVVTSDDSKVIVSSYKNGIDVLDIEDKTSISLMSTTALPEGKGKTIALKDDETVIVGTTDVGNIYIFNIADPYNLVQLAVFPQDEKVYNIILSADRRYAFVNEKKYQLYLFNIEDVENIELVTSDIPLGYLTKGSTLSEDQSLLYIPCEGEGLQVIETLWGQGYGFDPENYEEETEVELTDGESEPELTDGESEPEYTDVTCDITTIFSDCGYEGESATVDQELDCLEWTPKSICVQPGATAQIFNSCYFEGEIFETTENVDCFPDRSNANLMLASQTVKKNSKDSTFAKNMIHTRIVIKQ